MGPRWTRLPSSPQAVSEVANRASWDPAVATFVALVRGGTIAIRTIRKTVHGTRGSLNSKKKPPGGPAPPPWMGRNPGWTAQIPIMRVLFPSASPHFWWFPPPIVSCLVCRVPRTLMRMRAGIVTQVVLSSRRTLGLLAKFANVHALGGQPSDLRNSANPNVELRNCTALEPFSGFPGDTMPLVHTVGVVHTCWYGSSCVLLSRYSSPYLYVCLHLVLPW